MAFTFNDFIRLAKKAFKFWQSYEKKQKQQQQQQQQQQQGGYSGGNNQQNPYPQQGGQNNAWQQGQPHVQQQSHNQQYSQQAPSHGYGSHDGPATVRDHHLSFMRGRGQEFLPAQVMEVVRNYLGTLESRESGIRGSTSQRYLRRRLTIPSSFPSFPFFFPYSCAPHHRSFSTSFPSQSIFDLLPSFLRPLPSRQPRLPRQNPTYRPVPLSHPDEWNANGLPYDVWLNLQQQNQDMANAQNADYVAMRNNAIREGDLMGKCFSDSKTAYNQGDGARAKQLSTEGKEHQRKKEQFNAQAAQWIYNENNKRQPMGTVDLHGMYVAESVEYAEKAVESCRSTGLSELRLIVGKGNHSPQHIAKVKPAIEEMMARQKLSAHLDPHNSGVLVVMLNGQGGMGSREIVDGLQKNPDTCVIM